MIGIEGEADGQAPMATDKPRDEEADATDTDIEDPESPVSH